MEFVACVGTDEQNWGQITALLNRLEYEKAVLVVDAMASGYPTNDTCTIIKIDMSQPLLPLQREIQDKLKKTVGGEFEVALSLASGTGKEHMAVLSALLNIPVGVKLVVYTKEGIQFLS
ncbi:hypothetical protein FJZ22_00635 [Candidatus Pacearchaeota archaeon]|nr:hypothetical protein [Candidatus Pacearchaeota archaeon]